MSLTFVLLVRFSTSPDLMILSNSKLPFWFTGENVSKVSWPPRNDLADAGIGIRTGGATKTVALGMFRGGAGATSAIM